LRINFAVCNFVSASSEHQTIGSVVLIYSIVMAPKKAVVASRRSIRAIVRKPKASSDSQSVDMLSASAKIVVGSTEKSTNNGSLFGTESTEPRVVRRSRTTKKHDEHTVASEKVSKSRRSTMVTSEGRKNATRRSDIGGRGAAGMTTEDSSSNKNTTNLREGLVSESKYYSPLFRSNGRKQAR